MAPLKQKRGLRSGLTQMYLVPKILYTKLKKCLNSVTVNELEQVNATHATNVADEEERVPQAQEGLIEYTRESLPRAIREADDEEEEYEPMDDTQEVSPANLVPINPINRKKRRRDDDDDLASDEPQPKQRVVEPDYLFNVLDEEQAADIDDVHEDPSYTLKCRYCNNRFKSRTNLRRHMKTFHVKNIATLRKKVRSFPSWTRAVKTKDWLDENTMVGTPRQRLQVKAPTFKPRPKFRPKFRKWKIK